MNYSVKCRVGIFDLSNNSRLMVKLINYLVEAQSNDEANKIGIELIEKLRLDWNEIKPDRNEYLIPFNVFSVNKLEDILKTGTVLDVEIFPTRDATTQEELEEMDVEWNNTTNIVVGDLII